MHGRFDALYADLVDISENTYVPLFIYLAIACALNAIYLTVVCLPSFIA